MKDFRLLDNIFRDAYRSRDVVLERVDSTTILLRPVMVYNRAIAISLNEDGLTVGYVVKKGEKEFDIPFKIKDLPEFRDSISFFACLTILLLEELTSGEESVENEG
jgi:hypothetical protein